MHVRLYVDPASEASWRASRWLAIVEQARPIDVEFVLAPTAAGRSVARVAAAAGDLVGADGPRAVYEAYGRRRFALGEADSASATEEGLRDLQLPTFLTFAAGDTKWDAHLAEPPAEPLLIDGVPHSLPDLPEIPTGGDATALFDELSR
nr:hypothetical protein [Propionibacterium sp.]